MAKVISPLFSLDASGTIKKTMTFTHRQGLTIVTKYSVPSNPNSNMQTRGRINLATTSIIIRQTSRGRWTHESNPQTIVEFWQGRVSVGGVWSSALTSALLGEGSVNFNARRREFNRFGRRARNFWMNEARREGVRLVLPIEYSPRITNGFALYLLQYTNSEAGYQNLENPRIPNVITFAVTDEP